MQSQGEGEAAKKWGNQAAMKARQQAYKDQVAAQEEDEPIDVDQVDDTAIIDEEPADEAELEGKDQNIKREMFGRIFRAPKESDLDKFEEYKKKLDDIIAAGEPWTDPNFPPCIDSICKGCPEEKRAQAESIEWVRSKDLYEDLNIFKDGIDPSDIEQGALGDCYFLCTLAAMAEKQERVKVRFLNPEVNDAGCYLLSVFRNGIETPIFVDDWIPSIDNGGTKQAAFSRAKGGELWVALLEKAWAKAHGSYMIMEGGFPLMAAIHIQGTPGYEEEHQEVELDKPEEVDEFWHALVHADKQNYCIMAASHGEGEQHLETGIISGHAYSVISVHEITKDDQPVRLVQCRNPWGHHEWKGDWSDESDLWTDELREQVGSTVADDGLFFMTVQDYITNFRSTSFCVEYNMDKFIHNYVELDMSQRKRAFFHFELKEDIDTSDATFAVTVCQQGDRLHHYRAQGDEKFTSSRFNIFLMKKGTGIIGEGLNTRPQFAECIIRDEEVLKAGDYYIMVDPIWDPETTDRDPDYKKILLDIYCSQDVDIVVAPPNVMNMVRSSFVCEAKKSDDKDKNKYLAGNDGLDNVYSVTHATGRASWYGFMYFFNDSEMTLDQKLTFALTGMEILPKTTSEAPDADGNTVVNQHLEPGKDDLIIIKRVAGACKYSYGMELSCE